ncbi:MAG: TlpA family protein disulfide reductase [Bacteroides sp.]|nr:TlpA family protein disulfide reductase [Bacteroides sp.]
MMKNILKTMLLGGILVSCQPTDTKDYLKEVIANLETIESASYRIEACHWFPGESTPKDFPPYLVQEYHNPADTTIGACFVRLDPQNNMRFESGYDGKVYLSTFHDKKGVVEDDFTYRKLPFRPIAGPFFNYTRNILQYITETTDSIDVNMADEDSCYHVTLVVHEGNQIEFFGKAYRIPESPHIIDPTSRYEVWIRKSDNLPFRYKRDMEQGANMGTCIRPTFNQLKLSDFQLHSYIPEGYEVRKYGDKKKTKDVHELTGKPAPAWILPDLDEEMVSLYSLKDKVILLNFTGIGCGPCQMAIPFLKELKEQYPADDFEVIAIESWSGSPSARTHYAKQKGINYPFLGADEKVLDDYHTGRSAPHFFLLDEKRIVRKVFSGYGEKRKEEIKDAIDEMLK